MSVLLVTRPVLQPALASPQRQIRVWVLPTLTTSLKQSMVLCLSTLAGRQLGFISRFFADERISVSELAGDVLLNVSHLINLGNLNVKTLSRYLHTCLTSENRSREQKALRILAQMALSETNHFALANQISADVYSLMVSMCASRDGAVVLVGLCTFQS